MANTGEIIILSDDEDCEAISCNEPSVLIVETEDVKKSECAVPPTALDEDLVITFSRTADVLSHARYDCPIHSFTATDCEVSAPVSSNQLMCDQCFCYICDKLASLCVLWCFKDVCHCNSHNRSDFWNNQRNCALLGGLKTFNLTLLEIDSHLRNAETMLQSFRRGLATLFTAFVKGRVPEECGLSQSRQNRVYDYTPVYEFVCSFLNKADKQDGRAAAIMRLGATEDFIKHFQVSGSFTPQSAMANAGIARLVLLQRVVESVQRQMVMADFPPAFRLKLQEFYKGLNFPTELKSMKNCLSVRPWDDVLLVSVMKGQNVSGFRKDKGKNDFLREQISVVLLRTELLQRQHRYRELCRYLRVVETDNPKLFHQLQDVIPYFTCMMGDLATALSSLLPTVNAPATRFTPQLFLFYLCIFKTATAPKLAVMQPAELSSSDAAWEPIKDAVPLTHVTLVRFALRVQKCCSAVYTDAQCWTSILKVANTSNALQEPRPEFLHEATVVVHSILQDKYGSNIQIPRFFVQEYPDQALLLVVTGALCLRILDAPLSPALPVLNTFKGNVWALNWLWSSLSTSPERLNSFLLEFSKETEIMTGVRASL
ncbi:hypothetical protein PBY51_020053 [Eleginops maclovinus]|uniref:Uncharacterized protein n=1 Tax=Eleginops maclovinus TaxID=56733 RepID=A0AAN8AMV9_ELEMC|nr:hypothetical protein PBY51_020053 [Eleginops maclovinus]